MDIRVRLSRRGLLRAGAQASAGAIGLGSLAACGPQQAAAPVLGPSPTVIRWAPWGGWPAYAGPNWPQFVQPAIDVFQQQNPGLKIKIEGPGGGGSFVPQILAGTAPDVFQDWAIAQYRAGGLVLDVSRYIQQDNLNYAIWSPGQMNAMRDEEGTWFLPCYVHVNAMAINLSALDALGLTYPAQDWTHIQAAQLFAAATGSSGGKHRYGYSPAFPGPNLGDPNSTCSYVFHLFGGAMVDATRGQTEVGQTNSYQGVQWLDQLYWEKIAVSGGGLAGVPFCEVGSNALVNYLKAWQDNFKWTFFPVPNFPAGQYSFEATDYYAINAQTKHPDESWTFLRYLSAEPAWSRWCMKHLLRTPSIISLWPEYVQTVEAVAPLVKGKGLQWFTEAAAKWGVANRIFKYSHVNAINTLNVQLGKAFAQTESVALAMTSAARQVDALETAAAQTSSRMSSLQQQFPAAGGQTVAQVQPGL